MVQFEAKNDKIGGEGLPVSKQQSIKELSYPGFAQIEVALDQTM